MDEEGNNGGGPCSDGFVTGKQQQSERTPSGWTDSVPTIFLGDLKIPLEQVEAILQPSLCAAEARVTCMMQQFVESIESKILSAVKQAAMDIIKHLGKEAAMRVLVAERKSKHFEQELTSTKQEALTMLVQLKQSMDAQMVEAERACQIERRQTQETEEKLIILQGTVKKLKDELKRKREAVEKMQQMVHPYDEHCVVKMHSPTKYSTMRVRSSPRRLPQQILITKSYMPSIIMKSKEQAIPANGYNSGICGETINDSIADELPMSEGNENKVCLSVEDDSAPHSLEKSHDTDVASPRNQPVMHDVNCSQEQDAGCFLHQSSLLVNFIGQIDSCDGVSVHTDGKQYASSESYTSLGTKVKLMSTDISTGKVVNVETPNDLAHHPETYDTSILSQDRETKMLGFETSKTFAGDDEPASSFMENLDVPSVEKDAGVLRPNSNMDVKEKDIPKDNCRTSGKHGDEVINVESTVCSSHANSSVENGGTYLETECNKFASESEVSNAIRSDEWKTMLSVDSDITKTKCDKVMVTGNPSAVYDSNKITCQMRNIDATKGTGNQIFGNAINQRASCRDTKYTFQRKRRRESSFQNGNLIQEEKDPKRSEIKPNEYFLNSCSGKLPQKQITSTLSSQKSSFMSESPRDSRRLMLGAHQLVSLSEKKSWC